MKNIKLSLENVIIQLKKIIFNSIHHLSKHHTVTSQPIENSDTNYLEYLKYYKQATRWK